MKHLLFALVVVTSSAFAVDHAGCRPQLESSLCYTPDVDHWADSASITVRGIRRYQERTCQPMPLHIKTTLIDLYEKYPREIQQAFCEIKHVFVVNDDVTYGARAEYYFDLSTVKLGRGNLGTSFAGKPIGYILEISEKARFKGETNSAYLTRVLQARFGNANPTLTPLPVAQANNSSGPHGALDKTIVHELGHLIGRAQKVTPTYFLPYSEGAWSKLSFKLENGNFTLRHAPPGYDEMMSYKLLSAEDIRPTFDLFRRSGLATLYGGTSPQEDFAEFFMLHFYPELVWKLGNTVAFDLTLEMATNPVFRAKREIIINLLKMPQPFSLKNRGIVRGQIGSM
jgi:hypothetical protein